MVLAIGYCFIARSHGECLAYFQEILFMIREHFQNTSCTICGTFGNAQEIYPSKLEGELLDEHAFSARRFYDKKIHFRFVACAQCGLWRSDPIIPPEKLASLYRRSYFNYDQELGSLRATYGRYLSKLDKFTPAKNRLLEIGCGNGFFLEEALSRGWQEVFGVEPSEHAVAKAPAHIRPGITLAMFHNNLFPENFFDVVCIFQTLDHLPNPRAVIDECFRILRPGGVMLAINHDVHAWSAKLLGEQSPIIDIEHTYLFNKRTMRIIFEKSGFEVLHTFSVFNSYSLGYFYSLLPLPPIWLKNGIRSFLSFTRLAKLPLLLPIGNLGLIAKKGND